MLVTQEEVEERLEQLIKQYENTAEEYFQEIEDPEKGNEYLAKAAALQEFWDWMATGRDKTLAETIKQLDNDKRATNR